jgi:hypothetical protein
MDKGLAFAEFIGQRARGYQKHGNQSALHSIDMKFLTNLSDNVQVVERQLPGGHLEGIIRKDGQITQQYYFLNVGQEKILIRFLDYENKLIF